MRSAFRSHAQLAIFLGECQRIATYSICPAGWNDVWGRIREVIASERPMPRREIQMQSILGQIFQFIQQQLRDQT